MLAKATEQEAAASCVLTEGDRRAGRVLPWCHPHEGHATAAARLRESPCRVPRRTTARRLTTRDGRLRSRWQLTMRLCPPRALPDPHRKGRHAQPIWNPNDDGIPPGGLSRSRQQAPGWDRFPDSGRAAQRPWSIGEILLAQPISRARRAMRCPVPSSSRLARMRDDRHQDGTSAPTSCSVPC